MNFLLIVDDYLPHSTKIAAKMMHELAGELNLQGHQVFVITPNAEGISDKISNKNYKYETEIFDSIPVLRFPSGKIKNTNKLLRLINEFLLPYRAILYSKKLLNTIKFDGTITYSPSIFWSPLILKIKRINKAKSYLILRDFFPQWAVDNKLITEKSLVTKFLRYIEKRLYESSDYIGIQSPKNIDIFNQKFPLYKNRAGLLFNWANANSRPRPKKESVLRKKWKLENKVIFFYGGNIGHAQDMKQLLILAERMYLKYSEAFFLFIGSGDEVDVVKSWIKDKKLSNTIYLPSISQSEYQEILSTVDIGLFSLHPNHSSHNFPGKLLGYMQFEIPILGCVNLGNDLKDIIQESNSGFISYSDDPEALHLSAIKLLNPKTRKELGKNAKDLLDTSFSTKAAVKSILNAFEYGN